MNKGPSRKRISGADLATALSSAAFPLLAPNGSAAAPSYSFSAATNKGLYISLGSYGSDTMVYASGGTDTVVFGTALQIGSAGFYGIGPLGGTDVRLYRDLSQVLALKNGLFGNTFRVYGSTTGPQYTSIGHDGINGILDITGGGALRLQAHSGKQVLFPDGTSGLPSISFNSNPTYGFMSIAAGRIGVVVNGSVRFEFNTAQSAYGIMFPDANGCFFGSTAVAVADTTVVRDGTAGILAIKAQANNQTLRIYGTTTGPKYVAIKNDGTDAFIDVTVSGVLKLGTISAHQVQFASGSSAAPSIAFAAGTSTGLLYSSAGGGSVIIVSGGNTVACFPSNLSALQQLQVTAGTYIAWSSGGLLSASDVLITRDAANTLAMKNSTNIQAFRVYNSTTGPKYFEITSDANANALLQGTSMNQTAFRSSYMAANATQGFLCVPGVQSPPIGTPANIPAGQIPICVLDVTLLKIYAYVAGAWHFATLT